MLFGANEFTAEELEALFSDDVQQETPPAEDVTEPESEVQAEVDESVDTTDENVVETDDTTKIEQTKAFAKRLKKSTEKARIEEREAIAKSFGFDSYESMLKSRETKLIEDKGQNPEEILPIVEELVKQRLDNDPRMMELEGLRNQKVVAYGKNELAEISLLTGGKITRLEQLPREVIDLWKQNGSLKKAYLEIEGEKLINQLRSEHSKGTANHMNTVGNNNVAPSNKRPLTNEEKQMWKLFNPGISDEELNKKTTDK